MTAREFPSVNTAESWGGGVNLVEIDLLRAGDSTVRVSPEKLATIGSWHYLTAVTRVWPCRQIVYGIQLDQRLPRIAIPLLQDDVTLDLQAALEPACCINRHRACPGGLQRLMRYRSELSRTSGSS